MKLLVNERFIQVRSELETRFSPLCDQAVFENLIRVASLSDYFFNYLMNHATAEALVSSGDLLCAYDGKSNPMAVPIGIERPDEFDAHLRQIRHREMARIIYRDFSRLADMVETTRDLSDLADLCINLALKYHYDINCAKYGEPLSASGEVQQMCVLALGKLGAKELNLSSDVDLIFFYDEPGTVSGPSAISNNEFFIRTSRQVIKSLDEIQVDGFVFRVDMRLRPYGDSGSLILHRSAMEKYFVEQGRDWERYAYIKARANAGDIALGESFLTWLVPFVFRRHLDYGAVESLRDMKRLINNEVEHRSLKDDVKLGPGGIREVEFIVQAHQLIWGGNNPLFRHNRLLDTLEVLTAEGHFPMEDAIRLRDAYWFLRDSEHAIQGEKDKQTQSLPNQTLGQERLADIMGFEDYETYLGCLQLHRSRVSSCFAKLMSSNNSEEEILVEGNLFWVQVWNDLQSPSSAELLAANGFDQVPALVKELELLKDSVKRVQDIGFDRIQKLLPLLLSLSAAEVVPTETLSRLIPIIQCITRRSTYVSFLLENMDALCRLVHLCSMSPWLAERVAAHPILMYEMTDKSTNEAQVDMASMTDELNHQLAQSAADDLEAQMDTLRQFKHAAVLKVAIFELLNFLPTMKASDCLTQIAELILTKAMDLAFTYLMARHGEPCDQSGRELGRCFAVVAYGKLGGIELAYGSDLDIVFLHDADLHGKTSGAKSIANNVFFSRLGQRLIHILASLTRHGTLYEVDVRLRPDGIKGPLVSRFSAYQKYLEDTAWTWELQALVRARCVAGDQIYKEKFEVIRKQILSAPRDAEKLRIEVSDMRERMRKNIKTEPRQNRVEAGHQSTSGDLDHMGQVLVSAFDFKQDAGAIVDIEFLVQYLVLLHCHAHPELAQWTDKVRLLEQLQLLGLIDESQRKLLTDAYLAYRSAVHYTWLGGQVTSFEQLNAFRSQVMDIWREKFLA